MSDYFNSDEILEHDGVNTDTDSVFSEAKSLNISRSRIWSESITKYWNVRIEPSEGLEERVQRYIRYFKLSHEQMKCIYDKLLEEMSIGLETIDEHCKENINYKSSVKMLNTFITNEHMPNGREKGSAIVLEVACENPCLAKAANVTIENRGKFDIKDVSINLSEISTHPKGLLDSHASASLLFDTLASLVRKLDEEVTQNSFNKKPIPVVCCFAFPFYKKVIIYQNLSLHNFVENQSINNAILLNWNKYYETGRKTNDPVESLDMAKLLNYAFERLNYPGFTKAIISNSCTALLTCSFNKHPMLPDCRVAYIVGTEIRGCYVQPEFNNKNKQKGCIINCEFGNFDKCLPINDVDLEVDFAESSTKGLNAFDKMVSVVYLSEICRRIVVKVWENKAPHLAWVRYSLPWIACLNIIESPESLNLDKIQKILKAIWNWDTSIDDRKAIKTLFEVVFERSAALSAIAIVALSHQTQRLQPAMGGLTCALAGELIYQSLNYKKKIEEYLEKVLLNNTAKQINLYVVKNASLKGTALLYHKLKNS